MNSRTDELIRALEELSPMPPDDNPQLTVERMHDYGEVIEEIEHLVRCTPDEEDTRFIEPLIRSFGYGDAYGGYWPVVHLLEKYPAHILRPTLREATQTGKRGARMWCAYMLGCHRNPEDVPTLVIALQDPADNVRCNALMALAMIGEVQAKPAMEALLDDPSEEVRRTARESVEALSDQRFVIRGS